jgi:DNA-directed RNA polymerase subunit alpha
MNDGVSESAVQIDVAGILKSETSTLTDMLEVRNVGLVDKSVRGQVDEILMELPVSLEEAGRSTSQIRARGVALFVIGEDLQASRWLAKAGKAPLTVHLLGLSLAAIGRFAAAAEQLGEIAKEHPQARAPLAEACLRSGDAVGARKAIATLLKDTRESEEGRYLAAYLAELDGDYDTAYSSYRAVLAESPEHPGCLFRLAYMLDLDGNEDDAVEVYERLRQLRPTYTNALVNLGVLYEDRGEYTKAVEVYQAILDIYPEHPRAARFIRDAKASLNMYYDEDLERTEDRRAQILRIPISDFELSVRSRNCLAKMQIETLGDLIKRTEPELLSYKNFGETSLQEIKDILAQKGLRLGMGREEQTASVQAAARTLLGIEPERGDIASKAIEDLELSVRSRNAMSVLGLASLGDLCRLSEKDLMQVKNFGQTSMNEVKEKLAEFGLSLAEDS